MNDNKLMWVERRVVSGTILRVEPETFVPPRVVSNFGSIILFPKDDEFLATAWQLEPMSSELTSKLEELSSKAEYETQSKASARNEVKEKE